MKSKILRGLKIAALTIVSLILVIVTAVYGISSYRLNRPHDVPPLPKLTLSNSPDVLARGGHIATSFGMCTECHGGDLGGKVIQDDRLMFRLAAPNLTRGRGGLGNTLTDADWVRAIRHGIRPDGLSLILMPSEVFVNFAEDDLTALISYLKQLAPVDREVPSSQLYYFGRALLVADELHILTAEKTPRLPLRKTIDRTPSIAYGHYLSISCRSCHGPNLSGNSSRSSPSANLTPTGIGSWSEADFVRTLRTGKRPDGKVLHESMPWRQAGMMTDDELHAIWLYLRSVPARASGNK